MNRHAFVDWLSVSTQLKDLRKLESGLRKTLCSKLFDGRQGEFKEQREIEDIIVTGKSTVNRKIDEAVLNTILDELSDDERACVVYKPSIDLRKYRKLPEGSILHECITESPAMPTLEVEFKK